MGTPHVDTTTTHSSHTYSRTHGKSHQQLPNTIVIHHNTPYNTHVDTIGYPCSHLSEAGIPTQHKPSGDTQHENIVDTTATHSSRTWTENHGKSHQHQSYNINNT